MEVLVEELIKVNDLPDRGVIVTPFYSEAVNNKGSLISYYIMSNEPDYPATEEDLLDKNRHHSTFITLKAPSAKMWQGMIEIQVGSYILSKFPPPSDALEVYKQLKKDVADNGCNVQKEKYDDRFRIPVDSENLIQWVKDVVQYKISNYCTAAPSFGCCSDFERCSDAKRCIHPNRMYSTACSYRHNLESGRIFYGKNRNV